MTSGLLVSESLLLPSNGRALPWKALKAEPLALSTPSSRSKRHFPPNEHTSPMEKLYLGARRVPAGDVQKLIAGTGVPFLDLAAYDKVRCSVYLGRPSLW